MLRLYDTNGAGRSRTNEFRDSRPQTLHRNEASPQRYWECPTAPHRPAGAVPGAHQHLSLRRANQAPHLAVAAPPPLAPSNPALPTWLSGHAPLCIAGGHRALTPLACATQGQTHVCTAVRISPPPSAPPPPPLPPPLSLPPSFNQVHLLPCTFFPIFASSKIHTESLFPSRSKCYNMVVCRVTVHKRCSIF